MPLLIVHAVLQTKTTELIDSLEMQISNRIKILEACRKAAETRIVVTHGTDTMAYTASVLGFLLAEWRPGPGGAFIMGLRRGTYCAGCCAMLMLLLFVLGLALLAELRGIRAQLARIGDGRSDV